MDVLYANCAGLDIHKDTVVACSRRMTDGKVMREVRTLHIRFTHTPTRDRLCMKRIVSHGHSRPQRPAISAIAS